MESMRQTIVMAAARNGYSDAHDPDEMRWWIINEIGGWKAIEASEQLARFNDRVSISPLVKVCRLSGGRSMRDWVARVLKYPKNWSAIYHCPEDGGSCGYVGKYWVLGSTVMYCSCIRATCAESCGMCSPTGVCARLSYVSPDN